MLAIVGLNGCFKLSQNNLKDGNTNKVNDEVNTAEILPTTPTTTPESDISKDDDSIKDCVLLTEQECLVREGCQGNGWRGTLFRIK